MVFQRRITGTSLGSPVFEPQKQLDKVVRAGSLTLWDLAEIFDVTEEMIRFRLALAKSMYGHVWGGEGDLTLHSWNHREYEKEVQRREEIQRRDRIVFMLVVLSFFLLWWFWGRDPYIEIGEPWDPVLIYVEPKWYG